MVDDKKQRKITIKNKTNKHLHANINLYSFAYLVIYFILSIFSFSDVVFKISAVNQSGITFLSHII